MASFAGTSRRTMRSRATPKARSIPSPGSSTAGLDKPLAGGHHLKCSPKSLHRPPKSKPEFRHRGAHSSAGNSLFGSDLPSEGRSTVQVDDLTGYEASTVRRKPGSSETDFFWLSQPANGHSGKHPIELFTREVSNIGH